MNLGWLGRRWKLLMLVPTIVYVFSVPVSLVLTGLHRYYLAGEVLGYTADVGVMVGVILFVLFLIASLLKPLKGLPRIRVWFILLVPAPLIITMIAVGILGSYTSRGVFFVPVMLEAFIGSLLYTLGAVLIGSMLVPAGIGVHNFLVGQVNKPDEQRPSSIQRRHRILRGLNFLLLYIYVVGTVDFLFIHALWLRLLVVLLMALSTAIKLKPRKVILPIVKFIVWVARHASKTRMAKSLKSVTNRAKSNRWLLPALAVVIIVALASVPVNVMFGIYPPATATQVSKGVYLVANYPAGLEYQGPPTTALAGYYCIKYINPGNDYSIQLNMELNNGFWVQNSYGYNLINGSWNYEAEIWALLMSIHGNNTQTIGDITCSWLVTAISNGYIYFGYSLDGKSIVWYDKYPAFNATYIIQHRQGTNLVLTGWGDGQKAELSNALVYLALYYWNGTTWVPAPVTVLTGYGDTGETVNHAYVYTNNTCSAVVAYPTPTTETICPTTPSFNP
jgi:hypothetical protein